MPGLTSLERQAAADGLLSDHLRIHKAGRDVRTARGLILAGCAVVVVAALVILSRAPAWGMGAARRGSGAVAGPGRAPGGQADHHPRGAPGRGAAPIAGCDHPGPRRAGHRGD